MMSCWARMPPNATEGTTCWVHAWLLLPVPKTDVAESKIVTGDAAAMIEEFPPETDFSN